LLTIEIPDLGSSVRLDQVIPIEARKYVPVPITEVALDWWVIPKGRNDKQNLDTGAAGEKLVENNLEVLIAAVHRDLLKQYQTLGQTLNLNLNFFEIETFSTIRSVLKNDLAPKVILDMGAASTKMTIVDYGVIRLSHTIGKGGQDITVSIARSLSVPFAKAEEIKRKVGLSNRLGGEEITNTVSPTVDYIFSEVNRIMLEYEKKHKRAVDKAILVGAASSLQGLLEIATKHLSVPIVRGNPFTKIEAPAFLTPTLEEVGPSFAPAIGLALRELQDL
jgi:type IV pilus assembly protein PilM